MFVVSVSCICSVGSKNNEIEAKNASIREYEKVVGDLEEQCERWEVVCRWKDDLIMEMEMEMEGLTMDIPNIDTSTKTYMDYCKIGKQCREGEIVYDEEAWTDEDGLRRWGDFYCVALGRYYGAVGSKFWVETSNGNKYKIIKADEKSNSHTDSSNMYTLSSGCMMEWIVETDKLDSFVKTSGNINNISKVSGDIIKITKIKE